MTWMIVWGQRSKHQKIPGPKIYFPLPPTTRKLQLNQAAQDNTCQIFLPPKKFPESKISKPKKSSDHRRHLKSGVHPLGFCSTPNFLIESCLLMTYFITAKRIVEYEAESERLKSKREATTNGKRTKYPVFFENRNTLNYNWKTKHPQR